MDDTFLLEGLAFCAGMLSITSSAPQFYRILALKSAQSVSLTTYSMLFVSSILWVTYGLVAPRYSIVFWNALGVILTSMVILAKRRYDRQNTLQAAAGDIRPTGLP